MPEGLLRTIGHEDGVADDAAVEIDVGLGVDRDARELRRQGHGADLRQVTPGESIRPGEHDRKKEAGHSARLLVVGGFGERGGGAHRQASREQAGGGSAGAAGLQDVICLAAYGKSPLMLMSLNYP